MTTNFLTTSIGACVLLLCGCTPGENPDARPQTMPIEASADPDLDAAVRAILDRHDIQTAGLGRIEDGALVWAGYYGEQAPGIPASAATQFDIGSITKVVSAETVLRLVSEGQLDLDEPMGRYWIDPDLEDDPRALQLTPPPDGPDPHYGLSQQAKPDRRPPPIPRRAGIVIQIFRRGL